MPDILPSARIGRVAMATRNPNILNAASGHPGVPRAWPG
jgi:hypothetical protein